MSDRERPTNGPRGAAPPSNPSNPSNVIDATAAFQRLPPQHDLEAERAVLGGIILDNESFVDAAEIVVDDDFYHPAHGVIFRAMTIMRGAGIAIDTVTLQAQLSSMERLNTVGGLQYIGELTDWIPTAAHMGQYARIVADLAAVRVIQSAAREVYERGYTADVDTMRAEVTKLSSRAEKRSAGGMTAWCDAIDAGLDVIEQANARGTKTLGIRTGYRELDKLTTGMQPGELWIFGARPAMGKTGLALGVALNAAGEQASFRAPIVPKPILFFSLEMPKVQIVQRAGSLTSGVPLTKIRGNDMSADEFARYTAGLAATFQYPIIIDDTDVTMVELVAKVTRQKRKTGVALVVVDYLQLMKFGRGTSEFGTRELEVSAISRGLKLLAKTLEIPIVALAQLNRDLEKRTDAKRRPQLSDLRESGAIEQDADVVVFIYRDEVYDKQSDDKGLAELICAKQRNGPPDTVRVAFQGDIVRFSNLAADDGVFDDGPGPASSPAPDDPGPPEPDRREPKEPEWTGTDF